MIGHPMIRPGGELQLLDLAPIVEALPAQLERPDLLLSTLSILSRFDLGGKTNSYQVLSSNMYRFPVVRPIHGHSGGSSTNNKLIDFLLLH